MGHYSLLIFKALELKSDLSKRFPLLIYCPRKGVIHLARQWNTFRRMSLGFVRFIYFPKCYMKNVWIFTQYGRKGKKQQHCLLSEGNGRAV